MGFSPTKGPLCALFFCFGLAMTSPASEPLAWKTFQILSRSCAECHGGHLARPKARFGHVLDLARISKDPQLVVPGNPEASSMYTVLVTEDPDLFMPPIDSSSPQLTKEEIQVVYDWIKNGAGIDAATASEPDVEPAEIATSTPRFPGQGVIAALHPFFVHFPIALLLGALLAELVSLTWQPRPWLEGAKRWCLIVGTLGSLAAVATGFANADYEGAWGSRVVLHSWLGLATAALAVVVLFIYMRSLRQGREGPQWLIAFLLILGLLVLWAGHTGGELVYGKGYLMG